MSAHTSARLKAHQTQSQQTEPEIAPESSSKYLNDTEPARKRQKTTGVNTKAKAVMKRGKGKDKKKQETFLTELPLDILIEIFECLQPLDLLNLSYTAKELRSILTAEYASSIWKTSYMNVDPVKSTMYGRSYMNDKPVKPTRYGRSTALPPKCPSYVDIRHYTRFLFGLNCLFCAGPNGIIVHLSALTRLCTACARNELIDSNRTTTKRTPVSGMDRSISKLCWQSAISNNDVSKPGYYFLKRDYERHARALQQCGSNEAKARYKALQMAKKAENASLPGMIKNWFFAIREERYESIRSKLEEEGYTDLGRCHLASLPGAKKVAPLTDKEWNRIKPKLLPALELYLQDEKKKKKISTYTERLSHLSGLVKNFLKNQSKPWIHAPLPSIAKLEPFASVMRDTDRNENRMLIQTRLSELAGHIPELLTICRVEADEFLLSLLPGDEKRITRVEGEDFGRISLELATTFFKCRICIETDPISYPRILMHECLRARTILVPPSDKEPLAEVYGVPTVTAEHVWNRMSSWYGPTWNEMRKFIAIDEDATRSAMAIVRACGEDPKALTAVALKERNVRLECMRCVPREGDAGAPRSRHIMSWNMAILHDISKHPHDISAQGWSLVTSKDDLARAKEFEDKTLRSSRQKLWEHCRYCDISVRTNLSPFGAEHHLFQAHGIRESEPAALKSHIYVAVDAPLDAYPCAVVI